MINLFIYGTLQLPVVQKKIIGRVAVLFPDVLNDYDKEVVVIGGKTYPIAVRKPGKKIEGKILQVTESELNLIDDYETSAYQRFNLSLASGVKAWVYAKP